MREEGGEKRLWRSDWAIASRIGTGTKRKKKSEPGNVKWLAYSGRKWRLVERYKAEEVLLD